MMRPIRNKKITGFPAAGEVFIFTTRPRTSAAAEMPTRFSIQRTLLARIAYIYSHNIHAAFSFPQQQIENKTRKKEKARAST